jgi:transposase-like protein
VIIGYIHKKTSWYGLWVQPFRSPNLIFHDDGAAREALEALQWPDGPVCPRIIRSVGSLRCGATGPLVAKMGGVKRSHRDGLYRCKSCRGQFTVTMGTVFASSKVPLSKWMQAVHMVGYRERPPSLLQMQKMTGVTYKTMLLMWGRICTALRTYKGYKKAFGTKARAIVKEAQPKFIGAPPLANYRPRKNKLMARGDHPSQHTIKVTGLLQSFAKGAARTDKLERTERLLWLLVTADPKRWKFARKKAAKLSRLAAVALVR